MKRIKDGEFKYATCDLCGKRTTSKKKFEKWFDYSFTFEVGVLCDECGSQVDLHMVEERYGEVTLKTIEKALR